MSKIVLMLNLNLTQSEKFMLSKQVERVTQRPHPVVQTALDLEVASFMKVIVSVFDSFIFFWC